MTQQFSTMQLTPQHSLTPQSSTESTSDPPGYTAQPQQVSQYTQLPNMFTSKFLLGCPEMQVFPHSFKCVSVLAPHEKES